jgi:hypothetical protein
MSRRPPTGNGAPKHVVAEADRIEQQFNLSIYTNIHSASFN